MFPKYDRPFFFHFNPQRGDINLGDKNGLTVCFMPQEPGNTEFKVGHAICSERDSFSKKIGRDIAEGRAKKNMMEWVVSASSIDDLRKHAKSIACNTKEMKRV